MRSCLLNNGWTLLLLWERRKEIFGWLPEYIGLVSILDFSVQFSGGVEIEATNNCRHVVPLKCSYE